MDFLKWWPIDFGKLIFFVCFRDDVFNFQWFTTKSFAVTANLPNCSFFGRDLFEDIILTERRQTLKQSGSELFYHQPLCGRIPVTGLHFPMFAKQHQLQFFGFLSEIDITRISWTKGLNIHGLTGFFKKNSHPTWQASKVHRPPPTPTSKLQLNRVNIPNMNGCFFWRPMTTTRRKQLWS